MPKPFQHRNIALVDCNNFYCSCERVFRPDLHNRAIVVLSNNDGCVVSRSNEAKAAGVKMGVPIFQINDLVKQHHIAVFSSNYVLYANLSNRVMSILSQFSPVQEIYSIDESFLDLTGLHDIAERAKAIRQTVLQGVGIPVCVGIGSTKTLSKLANFIAKRHPRSQGIFDFNRLNQRQVDNVLHHIPVEEVWGIGRKLTHKLAQQNINTVIQLRDADIASMRAQFGVVMEKTMRELRGGCCIELTDVAPAKQQIINSRSFGDMVIELADLEDAVTHFISHAAKKLRDQQSIARLMQVFIHTNRFRQDLPQYNPCVSLPLVMPSADTIVLQKWAIAGLKSIFKKGYHYKKAGVILSEIFSHTYQQGDLFGELLQDASDNAMLMKTIDTLNTRFGKGTVKLSQDGSRLSWKMKQANKSPEYTTNWDELPLCN